MWLNIFKKSAPVGTPFLPLIMCKLSSAQTLHILTLLDSGLSGAQISCQTGVGNATISHICSEHWPDLQKSSGGHPTKLTTASVDYTHHMGKVSNATEASHILQDITNTPFSSQTLCPHPKKGGMKPVVKRKCPLLKPHHQHAQLEFAEWHAEWTIEDWKRVIWSDETTINCLGSDGRKYVWKDSDEGLSDRLVEGTVKFGGGNLMLWGCMRWDGIGYATRIEGKMDADFYVSILEDETVGFYGKTTDDIIFQQDSDPKHTSKRPRNGLKTMILLSSSGLHSLLT
jgi:hypothetical protein